MDGTGLDGSNIGYFDKQSHTKGSNVVALEGPIRMDICQQERCLVNDVSLKIKLTQNDNFLGSLGRMIHLTKFK